MTQEQVEKIIEASGGEIVWTPILEPSSPEDVAFPGVAYLCYSTLHVEEPKKEKLPPPVEFIYRGVLKQRWCLEEIFHAPTWLDIAKFTGDCIKKTGDRHHVFLEGLELTGFSQRGIPKIQVLLGS